MMERAFDSETLPLSDRLNAWDDLMSRTHVPTVFSVERTVAFRAALRVMDLGAVQVTGMTYSTLRSQRTPKLIRRSDPELYAIQLVTRGGQHLGQNNRVATLGANDLAMYCSFRPFDTWIEAGDGTVASMVAQIPRALLPFPDNKLDGLLARPMSAQEGIGALVAAFLTHLDGDTGPYRPMDGSRLGMVLIDLIAALLAHHLESDHALPGGSRRRALFLEVRAFILRNLGDPHLSPDGIAAAHHISLRYLQRLFQQHGLSVSAWIREQRLERCRRDLVDPALGAHPVHAIAARWGFPHPQHFSRAFHHAYGVSPRDYRHLSMP
ncbi:AraC family transcriptional regulator [Microtetraspora sp. NBRC 13810]|uniref:helix-turn-helix domain-containing protein n=1 Tax=Microtetraspora sp. NBRC 13810 TaxID=3030990 RepID=UPI0024A41DBB|nr:helix-turn-helix domain-containing protein [Microtetraspora sp. NBRC 13810]GLW12802.1 AraC family transcriptional regulator [Microtetraspora sp. NBRC 13810]